MVVWQSDTLTVTVGTRSGGRRGADQTADRGRHGHLDPVDVQRIVGVVGTEPTIDRSDGFIVVDIVWSPADDPVDDATLESPTFTCTPMTVWYTVTVTSPTTTAPRHADYLDRDGRQCGSDG